ncbi:uncharacterized protein BO66DRAFT_463998, partial [Aspergillus aculeatinus CBS 121060]
VKVTRTITAAPSSPGAHDEARNPRDTETDDSWRSGDVPAHRQTDVYLIHEVCWHRLLEHFGPDELHLGSLFEALELSPYTPGHSHCAFTPDSHPSFWSTFEDQEIRREGRFGLPALEELMRFPTDPPLPAPYITKRRRASHRRRTGRDGFQCLPLEIIEAIAILLPTRDVLHLRCASRGFVGIFSSRAFWKTRFEINGERGFLLPVLRNYFERKRRRRGQEEEGRSTGGCSTTAPVSWAVLGGFAWRLGRGRRCAGFATQLWRCIPGGLAHSTSAAWVSITMIIPSCGVRTGRLSKSTLRYARLRSPCCRRPLGLPSLDWSSFSRMDPELCWATHVLKQGRSMGRRSGNRWACLIRTFIPGFA